MSKALDKLSEATVLGAMREASEAIDKARDDFVSGDHEAAARWLHAVNRLNLRALACIQNVYLKERAR
jgi:hypothetical protein